MLGVSDRYNRVVRVLRIETVDAAVQQDIQNEKALEEKYSRKISLGSEKE